MKELTRRSKSQLIALVIVAQVAVLCGMYLNSAYPLWFGEKVTLSLVPIDPRSLFRGQYVRLNYDISELPVSLLKDRSGKSLREGEILYVSLRKEDKNLWSADTISVKQPPSGLFIRGRVQDRSSRWQRNSNEVRIRYGIEAYFASPKKAKEIELQVRGRDSKATAEVMIAANGKAALLEVH
jgi:uncharacterized membrane-anchored protein